MASSQASGIRAGNGGSAARRWAGAYSDSGEVFRTSDT
jgi:hypothetical protein